jgi:hypothetical protein
MHPWRIVSFSASLLLLSSGCGLFLDTSPPDEDHEPDASVCDPMICNDGIACTVDVCGDAGCVNRLDDSLCGANETCVAGFGCASEVECAIDADCVSLALGKCGIATCNTDIGRCVTALDATVCDDLIACTADVCNADGTCASTASDALCDDSATCTTFETCEPGNADAGTDGCIRQFDYEVCNDDLECTLDACDPAAKVRDAVTGCVNFPEDYACGTFEGCTQQVCVPASGCEAQVLQGSCDPNAMTCDVIMGFCIETSDCADDGNPCNGVEERSADGSCGHKDGIDSCGAHPDPCKEYYCDSSDPNAYECAERVVPTEDCYGFSRPQ